ncbi:class I SAM-dependent methyltransferase [Labedella populi]|uniref:Class I SAM-dependent methyltransferase n=1 Tax=Labedella populi TaxID=2498850 RepID=A0A3S4E230_9MICO|nr:class I SAM-dependent methyltransferase [Labedella populi]RWZ61589.1 class I SAM-dependent methyltransferase [Labedella populi]
MSDAESWSEIAEEWARSWGSVMQPVHVRLLDVCRIEADSAVLDVGCGSGEFLASLLERGAHAAGVDPAAGMVAEARRRAGDADIREGSWRELPWPDASFDVVATVNALQYADDTSAALTEARRVLRAGGLIAVANWADRELNQLDAIESALATAAGDETPPDGDLRLPGGLEAVLVEAGFDLVEAGTVDVTWAPADDVALLRGVLLDDDPHPEDKRVVLEAAAPFRRADGGYVLENVFRYAVGRTSGAER